MSLGINSGTAILMLILLAGCQATAPDPSTPPATVVAPTASTPASPTLGLPTPPPTLPPAPARLMFGSKLSYPSSVCLGYGHAVLPFRLTVKNTGDLGANYLWFKIGDLGAIAGAMLWEENWKNSTYIWDDNIFSASMGYLFIRGPLVKAHQSLTLKFSVRTGYLGMAEYSVAAFTGPASISLETDLRSLRQTYGPLVTLTQFC